MPRHLRLPDLYLKGELGTSSLPYLRYSHPTPLYPPYYKALDSFMTSVAEVLLAHNPIYAPSDAALLQAMVVDVSALRVSISAARMHVDPAIAQLLQVVDLELRGIASILEDRISSIPEAGRTSRAYYDVEIRKSKRSRKR